MNKSQHNYHRGINSPATITRRATALSASQREAAKVARPFKAGRKGSKVYQFAVFRPRIFSLEPSAYSGLTVLEILVAMGVAMLFYGVLYSFYQVHARALKVQEIKLEVQESSRLVIDLLVRDLRVAGARPVRGSSCDGFEGLLAAERQQVTLQHDFRGNTSGTAPDGCPDDPNERLTYVYEPTTHLIKRATGGGAPQPFIGNVAADGFLLRYFDREGNEFEAPLNSTQRATVQSIIATVRISRRHPDPSDTAPLTSEHTSTIFLLNPLR